MYSDILENNLVIISQIIQTFAVVGGILLFMTSIFEFKKLGESKSMMQQHSALKPVMLLVCAAVLLVFPAVTGALLIGFWGDPYDMSYGGDTNSGFGALMPAIFMFVRIVGLVSFLRGIFLLSRASGQQSQPGSIGKACIHMFSGILCLHVVQTMNLLGSILGIV